ncbi:hypothetical protein Fcan01_07407 [Folsomia candida]|uniref:Transmembrane protein 94 n=1 Tax=Folsomia candida TaxID=158441 RepID=A0A226EKX5_FOLCA|nr:hypothetical protein Fcan01_07407 [Folsomia candida]
MFSLFLSPPHLKLDLVTYTGDTTYLSSITKRDYIDERVRERRRSDEWKRLITALTEKLEAHKSIVGRNWREILQSSLSTRSRHSTITWSSLLILLAESIIIFTLYTTGFSHMWTNLLPEGLVMFFLFVFNTTLVIWGNYKRVNELPTKLEKIIIQLRELMASEILWEEKNYPDLFMPVSPCISLQWCYRDGKLVNLPWALLVQGDVIVLHAAQKIVADCELLNDPDVILKAGEIYSPNPPETENNLETENPIQPPRLHPPLSEREAIVTAAPYLEMVDLCLDIYLHRPPSFYNKERHTVVARIVECVLLPLAIMTFVALCLVRMFYLPHWLGIRVARWADIILLQPMASTFPLIPIALPTLWTLLQCIGNAKLWKGLRIWGFSIDKDILASPGKGEKVVLNEWKQQTRNFIESIKNIKSFFLEREETLHRSQKVLDILASTTALCCVDKKGILSWPNPTADKLFFFRTVPGQHPEESSTSSEKPRDPQRRKSSASLPSIPMTTIAEVLDITVDSNNELHFDDTHWENYLGNLKPLGLNILLNTCNPQTQETYSSFHSHISHEVMFSKKNIKSSYGLVIPVTSRRCLCEVANMIGFKDKATTAFTLEQQLCSYRHIESDQLSRDQLTKAKIKFPFPHMMSIVMKEKASHTLQLFSQGTGDIVTDVSEDFWDGKDLRPINENERKLISDFYQRSSLSSICTAFAYRPVQTTVNPSIASLYMELPPSKGLRVHPSQNQGIRNSNHQNSPGFLNMQDSQESHISTDCLLDLHKISNSEIRDVQGSLDLQIGQIFLGMVTMQYAACIDIVSLIEQLDQGCIRFVHFSKENELRSRVFSEKMGLESGWNCHISLAAPEDATSSKEHLDTLSYLNHHEDTTVCQENEEIPMCRNNRLGIKRSSCPKPSKTLLSPEETVLLPRCSASVPEMVLLSQNSSAEDDEGKTEASSSHNNSATAKNSFNESLSFAFSSDEEEPSTVRVRFEEKNLNVGADQKNSNRPSSILGSTSSAVLSPDSFPEMYELTEHPTPLGIDLTNRAQLPVGIENIRPHLDSVDNVPLLVSLFTDCNAENTGEMISIMQDYGEITLLLGSACNYENRSLFLQADASVAVEPLYPQSCQRRPTFVEPKNGCASPTDIAMLLTSLPCALSLKRKDCSLFYDLIAQARHFMNKCVRNAIQFWICCNCSVTFLGLLALLMLLPPLFSLSDSIWLSCIIIPILTMGLAFSIINRVDISVMSAPSFKNQMIIDRQMVVYSFWCYGMKFIPSVVNVVLMARI